MQKDYSLDLKLYRIINGYFYISLDNTTYKIVYADQSIKYKAEMLYVSIMNDSRFDTEYLKQEELDQILMSNEIWNSKKETDFAQITTTIDDKKIELYKYFKDEKFKKSIQKEIEMLKNIQLDMHKEKHSLDYLTLGFFASNIKNKYILSQSIFTCENEPVFGTVYQKLDHRLLDRFVSEINKESITEQELRDICLGELWSRYTCSDSIFGPSIELNDDQINLLTLTKMYNNVKNHPECPDDEIIKDRDALDGWFLEQSRKVKETKLKNHNLSKVRGKVAQHDNVYVFTNDIKETRAIHDMNDTRGKKLVSDVQAAGTGQKAKTDWKDLPTIGQDLKNKAVAGNKKGLPKGMDRRP